MKWLLPPFLFCRLHRKIRALVPCPMRSQMTPSEVKSPPKSELTFTHYGENDHLPEHDFCIANTARKEKERLCSLSLQEGMRLESAVRDSCSPPTNQQFMSAVPSECMVNLITSYLFSCGIWVWTSHQHSWGPRIFSIAICTVPCFLAGFPCACAVDPLSDTLGFELLFVGWLHGHHLLKGNYFAFIFVSLAPTPPGVLCTVLDMRYFYILGEFILRSRQDLWLRNLISFPLTWSVSESFYLYLKALAIILSREQKRGI